MIGYDTEYDVVWSVEEVISGPGQHDGGLRDKDRFVVAEGKTRKSGDSVTIRAELTQALEQHFPRHSLGSTYDIDRIYHIEITEVV